MEDVGLIWNPKKCAVAQFKRGVRVPESTGLLMSDGNVKIPTLEDGQQYKFLGVLETLRQEEKIVLRCVAREYLRRLSVIWLSPLSDYHRVIASNQFALPAMSYFMWTQHWPITELRQVDRDARKIVTEGGGKHPCGTTSLLYLPRDKGGRGLRSVETEYKETKVKAAVKLYQNRDPVMKMVREFEEQAESKGYQSMTKEAAKYAEEYGLQLQLKHPDPVCVTEKREVVPGDKLKTRVRKLRESRMEGVVEEQKWQGKLITARKEDGDLTPSNASGGSMNGKCAQHTPSQVCLKFMNCSYQQDCMPSTRPKQVLIVTLPAGCAVQHQRAWLIYSLLVLRWPKQSTWQGMTQF